MSEQQRDPQHQPPGSDDADQQEPVDGGAYGPSSAESGGNYDSAGSTAANIEAEPMAAEETTSDEPSPR